jgi:NADH-quinone oxidoreductase subunit A
MPDNYFARYLPLLIQIGIALLLACGMVVLSTLMGKHRFSRAKFQPYECGITPTGDARERFSVKFYLVAMLFILFDVEAVFLYPWAVIFKDELRMFGFWEMLVYIGIVLVGFFYIWKKGALDWSRPETSSAGLPSTPAMMRAPEQAPASTPPLAAGVEGSKS